MYYNFWGLDITMCFGKDCPLKNDCIRYVAKPEKYQSYFEKSPYNDGKCDCYRDYKEYDEKCIKEKFLKYKWRNNPFIKMGYITPNLQSSLSLVY